MRRPTLSTLIGLNILGGTSYANQQLGLYGSSLAAYFPMWEPSGTVMTDIKNARNGAYVGSVVLGATGIGDGRTSCNFNAVAEANAYTAGLAGALDAANFYASWWGAVNNISSYTDAASHNFYFLGASATMYYQSRLNGDGTLSFISRRGATVKSLVIDAPTTARWVHYAMVGDTANDRIVGYVNGAKQRAVTTLGTWSGAFADSFMQIGDTSPAVGNVNFPGRMAHFVLANVIPSDGNIRLSAQQRGQVVFVGDSRTSGKLWDTAAVELAFPDGLYGYGSRGVANWGVTGYTWALIQSEAATIDALLGSGSNVLVVWAGVNRATEDASQIYARMVSYCNARRAAGWKVIICSEIDSQADMTWHNTVWPALNVLIAADHSFADGYVNLGGDARLQNALDTTYFNADKIHLTTTGYAVVRDLVYPVLATM